ncbi:hypothetical protein [Thermococcus sp. GR4]|uniref:DUF7508 domain-containing protein n=1 Tax=Thermococcus sp. GR4 TaxID=1638254 RepID=UPI0019800705|nr:hypothetical protein [Thermococcus sp. GR4]
MVETGIFKPWTRFTKQNVQKVSEVYGVYEIANAAKETIYIGSGKLRSRLLAHFPRAPDPIVGASYFRYEKTGSLERARQRERALLKEYKRKHGKLPKFNQKIV